MSQDLETKQEESEIVGSNALLDAALTGGVISQRAVDWLAFPSDELSETHSYGCSGSWSCSDGHRVVL